MHPATGRIVARTCYICGTGENPVIASESVEHRFGRPLMPEGVYDFVRCRNCSTLYVDSDVDEPYLASIYEHETILTGREGLSVDVAHRQVLDLRLPEFQHHWSLLKRFRPPRSVDRLLDMGCQMGDFGELARQEGVRPHGIELSSDYASRCRVRWQDPQSVHEGPLSTARFPKEHFQYIAAFETLEHILDPIGALKQFHGWLAHDGLVAFTVPASDYFHLKFWLLRTSWLSSIFRPLMERYREFYVKQVLPHTHIYNFSQSSAKQMLKRAGFEPVYIGLTGWHGPVGRTLAPISSLLSLVSRRRLSVAPSIIAIGRKKP